MNMITDRKPAVLVIDDEEKNLNRLKELFTVLDFQCYTAANYTKGLKLFESVHEEIDLIFLDILMPDGNNILHKIKKIKPSVKVICMSNNSRQIEGIIKHMNDVGLVDKPVSVDNLLKELNDIVQ